MEFYSHEIEQSTLDWTQIILCRCTLDELFALCITATVAIQSIESALNALFRWSSLGLCSSRVMKSIV